MKSLNEAELLILEQLQRDFFDGNPVVIGTQTEGQRFDDDGNIVLGCYAGPSLCLSNLCHEMAHLAEREVPKLLNGPYHNWGYSYGKYWEVAGRCGYEPQTDQAVHREKRIWAYQISLQRQYGITSSPELPFDCSFEQVFELAKSVVWMDSFFIYRNKVTPDVLFYQEREKLGVLILAKEIEKLSKTEFTFERFRKEWDIRMEALKKNPIEINYGIA